VAEHADVAPELVARLRAICAALPETVEEQAWAGTRWVVRKKNFAHVVMIDAGWPPGYARAAGTDGPAAVLTFRASGTELAALTHAGRPFFKPPWFADIVGMTLAAGTDWTEVAELITESYCVLAPKQLADRVRSAP
jgi:hypothetical protein